MIASSSPSQDDDFDLQLAQFFRGEVPDPWPRLTAPVASPAARRESKTLSAGRMALAASIALLLLGGWYLNGRLPTPVNGSLDNGNATLPRDMRTMPHSTPMPRGK
jgi:hypothetical protein